MLAADEGSHLLDLVVASFNEMTPSGEDTTHLHDDEEYVTYQ